MVGSRSSPDLTGQTYGTGDMSSRGGGERWESWFILLEHTWLAMLIVMRDALLRGRRRQTGGGRMVAGRRIRG
jgi:hypothetical protein